MFAPITISKGNFETNISPELGGALPNFREHGPQGWIDWLGPALSDCANVLQSACFPLVPFSNRITQGRFKWRGKSIALPANFPSEPMPAGIGLHPYFPRTQSTHLKADIAAIHLNGADGLPLETQTNHPTIQSLCGGDALIDGLDNVFKNWDGTSLISWLDDRKSLTMSADGNLLHLISYTPEGADFFCAEPV